MLVKVMRKGRVTIPAPLRERLGLRPGDSVEFKIGRSGLLLRRVEPLCATHTTPMGDAFSDWGSNEDEEAFRDL